MTTNGPGVWFGDTFTATTAVRARAAALATALPDVGVRPGSRVVMLGRNSLLPLELTLAAAAMGAQVIPLGPHSTAKELAYVLADSGAVAVVGDADLLRATTAVTAGVVTIAQRTPAELARAFAVPAMEQDLPHDALDYDELAAIPPGGASAARTARDATTSNLFYTSGTTGRPKGVLRPPATPAEVVQRQAVLAACFAIAPDSVALVPTPLSHMFGANFAQTALRVGATLVVMPRFDPLALLQLVERHGVTHVSAVATMFVRLLRLADDDRSGNALQTLERVIHTGAPCPPAVKQAMIDWLGPVIWEQYGSTETGVVTLAGSAEWLAHRGTVGRPFAGSEVAVYDEAGRRCPPGVVGEVYARMHGTPDFTYLGRPDARAAIERDGLISAGDIGELDDDGYLHLHDRRTDLILSGGSNVYPAEVEAELVAHPHVDDCVVFGVPDDEFGQRVVAAVRLRPEVDAGALAALGPFLRASLTSYKVPREFVLIDEVPRTDSAKAQRASARELYLQHAEA